MRWSELALAAVAVGALATGVAVATVIGPDDWLDSPPQTLNAAGEAAVVTTYGLLSSSLPLRVTASTEAGEVFVGLGHAIDVDDFVRRTSTVGVDGFTPMALTFRHQAGASARLPAHPRDLDFWRVQASGVGEQSISGEFAGLGVVALVSTPNGDPSAFRISIGSRLNGAFAGSCAVAGLGIALLALAGWRGLPHRRGPAAASVAEPTPGATRLPRAMGALCIATTLTLAATGCTREQIVATGRVVNVAVPARAELTRDPTEGLDLTAMAVDYDRRNNLAMAAALAPRYSAKEWQGADGELELASDRFITAWNRVKKVRDKPQTCRTKLGVAYPGVATLAYPMAMLASEAMSCGKDPDRAPTNLVVIRREHSYTPWVRLAVVAAGKPAPPAPASGEPSHADRQVLRDAAGQIIRFLNASEVKLQLPSDLLKWRSQSLRPTSWSTSRWSASILADGIRVGHSENGAVAVVSILVTETTTAKPNHGISWSYPWDRIYRQRGNFGSVTSRYGLTVSLQASAGRATVLNWSCSDYLN